MRAIERLETGEVGYIATGLKNVSDCRVGDTLHLGGESGRTPTARIQPMKSMVFASAYPSEAADYLALRDALAKLQLNECSLEFRAGNQPGARLWIPMRFSWRLSIWRSCRSVLRREYDLDLVFTAPSVEYEISKTDGDEILIDSPIEMPDPTFIREIREPWIQIDNLHAC